MQPLRLRKLSFSEQFIIRVYIPAPSPSVLNPPSLSCRCRLRGPRSSTPSAIWRCCWACTPAHSPTARRCRSPRRKRAISWELRFWEAASRDSSRRIPSRKRRTKLGRRAALREQRPRRPARRSSPPPTAPLPSSNPWLKVVLWWANTSKPFHCEFCRTGSNVIISTHFQDRQIAALLNLIDNYCRQHNLATHVEFQQEHPIQEAGRLLLSVLIKHLGIASSVLQIIDQGKFELIVPAFCAVQRGNRTISYTVIFSFPKLNGRHVLWRRFMRKQSGK